MPQDNNTKTPVTVIGLGAMGSALAGAFLGAGHPTTVWNRSAGKGEDLVARGAVRAASAAEAVRAGDLVVVCVVDYDASAAVLEPLAADLAGRTLVNLTSDTPERAREAAAWAAAAGVDYLDGSVMVPTAVIGTPDALLFHAGPRAAYDKHEQTLKALGGHTTYVGEDHGLAAVYDLSLLDYFWTAMSGLVHAFALAAADGVPAAAIAPFLKANAGLVTSIVDGMAAEIDSGSYPGAEANLAMEVAGIDHIVHTAERRGLDATVLRAVNAVARRAIDLGHGADDWTATVEAVRKP
ncbi:NAD(P)-dependent oxidoreductase [Streptomyces spectabilis]|uniref:3-hydroxyisobutyrate dehydrogenase-like beta-hydroxyacid dehydrogenase n=1 Tax=Streptomyces spectabilis TaxID=68270 RepID=A0A5P2XEU7_STRST|nr:NAD(P)-binding domain-containing protein [Streptomyces spectabilis]MBB5104409.1 3-hydroxyisobutyrate dehydrogenase-like beta-hydroxyacid dehydrogenase [Streptomyces spectabilis]MCI3905236.1 NAD(P)-binding domain-containing protein [Streptomyces spectabilis]QEV62244.1 NAD(P)-dependent oxidoreductase [Streptomyces spectabilis]GGU99789.1 6-phosphogluconate dehydrogenase [Streptomyces spectabilis]